jgi:hypothetical protein
VLSPWLGFWWVLIAVGSACLCRQCTAGNDIGGGIISGQGWGRETFSGRACGKHELSSAGDFPLRGKPPVVIGGVPSPLAEHHRPSRSDSTRPRTICVNPVVALPRPTGPRPIFCLWTDEKGPGQTLWVTDSRRPARQALTSFPLHRIHLTWGFF